MRILQYSQKNSEELGNNSIALSWAWIRDNFSWNLSILLRIINESQGFRGFVRSFDVTQARGFLRILEDSSGFSFVSQSFVRIGQKDSEDSLGFQWVRRVPEDSAIFAEEFGRAR